jgi:hypothetical protein
VSGWARFTGICATEQDVLDLVTRVAAAERARIVAKIRDRAKDATHQKQALRDLADELEADHG